MQERTSLEDSLGGIGKVERELEDNVGMIELGEAENDEGVVAEAEAAARAKTSAEQIHSVKLYLILAESFLDVLRDVYDVSEESLKTKPAVELDDTLSLFLR